MLDDCSKNLENFKKALRDEGCNTLWFQRLRMICVKPQPAPPPKKDIDTKNNTVFNIDLQKLPKHFPECTNDQYTIVKISSALPGTATVNQIFFQVKIYSEPAETWLGPGVQVDAVLVIQSLMYIEERQTFLSKCREWLKPRGILLVVSNRSDSFLIKVGEWQLHICKSMFQETFESLHLRSHLSGWVHCDRGCSVLLFMFSVQAFEPKSRHAKHADFTRTDLQAIGITDIQGNV